MFSPRPRSIVLPLCLAVGALVGAGTAQAQQPDNTKTNQRDRKPNAKTADQQKNDHADLETTKEIRRSITADKNMSTYAKNVKVITKDGKVTLKGPVRTSEEKTAIEAKAAEVAGRANVTSQISIANSHPTTNKK